MNANEIQTPTQAETELRAVADVFRAHAREIRRLVRECEPDYRIMAEVSTRQGRPRWAGVVIVTPGTGSLLAHAGQGYALFMRGDPTCEIDDVDDVIDAWLVDMLNAAQP